MRQVFLTSKSVGAAQNVFLERFSHLRLEHELVTSCVSQGRVTAEPVFALNNSPHYAASAMDGFAVASDKTLGALPGKPLKLKLGEDCFPVDTGDPLPRGTDAVIMVEHTLLQGDNIAIEQGVSPWQHVRPVGEDIVATEMLFPRGHQLSAVDVGALLAAGVSQLAVQKKIRAMIIPTGDELVKPGTPLKDGDIVEFNSAIIAGLLSQWGVEPMVHNMVPDDPVQLNEAVLSSVGQAEMVIVIAGSSTGRGDYTRAVIEQVGTVLVHGVAMKPGKPVIMGEVCDKPVIGLPGYPVSAHLCMELFVKPLVHEIMGLPLPGGNESLTATLTRRLVSPFGVDEYVKVKLGYVDERMVATPLSRGAGVVTSLVKADGIVLVPHNTEGYAAGEGVEVRLTRSLSYIRNSLVSIGSHDPCLDILDDLMRGERAGYLSSSHVGSMGGILSLAKGECHFAPVHLLDVETGEYNVPFIERYFAGKPMVLVNIVSRWQGFMLGPDTPMDISWSDLPKYAFVNRQKGSGTRLLLDYHLKAEGVDLTSIKGYGREETTHLSVACAVKSGEADVGLGVLSAAQAMHLGFKPLCLEQYDMLLPLTSMGDPRVVRLVELLKSAAFAERVKSMGGYDTSKSGQIIWGDNIAR